MSFSDSALEKEFINYYDYDMRAFNEIGIGLSFVSWFVLNIFCYQAYLPSFKAMTIAIGVFLFPLFAVVLLILRSKHLVRYYQPLSAIANGMAGFVFIYVGNYILHNNIITLFGVITCIVFAFYILRLRFKYAIATTLIYVGTYQIYILMSSAFLTTEVALLSFIVWVLETVCIVGGYFMELATRKVFYKNKIIEQQKLIAEVANRAKSDFLARMSHELRTPIAGIIGFADIMPRQGLNARQTESVSIIQECSKQLLRMVNDVLDISKIEAGKISLDYIDFELKELIDESVSMVASRLTEKGLKLTIIIDPGVPQAFRGDANRLRQVVANLLSNAVKFTSIGEITIIANSADKNVADGSFPLLISVIDTGIGMTEQEQNHIFEPFAQADSSTTRKFGGTGLGLTISKNLVELMNGSIWLDSRKNLGTTVTFWLPLEPAYQQRKVYCTDLSETPTTLRPISVLIVEDIEVNQKLLSYMLEKLGCSSMVAGNGYECLNLLDHHHFDLILMDMQMPIRNGYDTTRSIRENHDWDRLPIIALTAHALEGDEEKCKAAGCNHYLTKPFTVDQLCMAINYCLKPIEQPADVDQNFLDSKIYEELKKEFLLSLQGMFADLETAYLKNDLEAMRSTTHDIKGTAGFYGYNEIAVLAAELNSQVRLSNDVSNAAVVSAMVSSLSASLPAS
ncbi:MAG: ATP-binding protein [Ignavibacteriales bacterium]